MLKVLRERWRLLTPELDLGLDFGSMAGIMLREVCFRILGFVGLFLTAEGGSRTISTTAYDGCFGLGPNIGTSSGRSEIFMLEYTGGVALSGGV